MLKNPTSLPHLVSLAAAHDVEQLVGSLSDTQIITSPPQFLSLFLSKTHKRPKISATFWICVCSHRENPEWLFFFNFTHHFSRNIPGHPPVSLRRATLQPTIRSISANRLLSFDPNPWNSRSLVLYLSRCLFLQVSKASSLLVFPAYQHWHVLLVGFHQHNSWSIRRTSLLIFEEHWFYCCLVMVLCYLEKLMSDLRKKRKEKLMSRNSLKQSP